MPSEKTAREAAAAMLARRPLSESELLTKLAEKGFTDEEREDAAERMRSLGALNDAEYARSLARSYAVRGFGAGRVREELRRRGVARELWQDALLELPEINERAETELRRRLSGDYDEKTVKRATDFMLRRGFAWSEIKAALSRIAESAAEEE